MVERLFFITSAVRSSIGGIVFPVPCATPCIEQSARLSQCALFVHDKLDLQQEQLLQGCHTRSLEVWQS